MRKLAAFSDNAVTRLARRSTPRTPPRRPPATEMPVIRELVVTAKRQEADDVVSLRLAAPDGGVLAPWQPGAHIELRLPSGREWQYSLCGDPADRHGYRIVVRRIADGKGGSAEVHDTFGEGMRVAVTGRPRNAFPFAAEASILLIAGGIGITPILPMAREAAEAGWTGGSCTPAAAAVRCPSRQSWPNWRPQPLAGSPSVLTTSPAYPKQPIC